MPFTVDDADSNLALPFGQRVIAGVEMADKNYSEAMRWYRMAADRGDAAAQLNVGGLYHNGWGVPQNYPEAMQWFRKSADQGNPAAQNDIGILYANGRGVPQDYA